MGKTRSESSPVHEPAPPQPNEREAQAVDEAGEGEEDGCEHPAAHGGIWSSSWKSSAADVYDFAFTFPDAMSSDSCIAASVS